VPRAKLDPEEVDAGDRRARAPANQRPAPDVLGLHAPVSARLFQRRSPTPDHRGGLPCARLRSVLAYIETHLAEVLRLEDLAALARLSTDHFAVQFRQSTGSPPHRYVVQRRIERSKTLVAETELSLAEIGYALGFAHQAHFTTTFRKLVGVTPGTYRRRFSSADQQFAADFCKSPLNSARRELVLAAKFGVGGPHAPAQARAAT
jgi:AraC-like DNA-binding protein